jgi:hypothetical protein
MDALDLDPLCAEAYLGLGSLRARRGDLLRLRWDEGELEIVARRATYSFTSMWQAPPAPERVPAELVPMLQRGATAFRERVIRRGDRLRVRRAGADGGVRLDEILPLDS